VRCWPRRAGGHDSDITDNVVRRHALGLGLVDVKVAAIDKDWSGLRLVWRVSNRLPERAYRTFDGNYASYKCIKSP